MVMEVVEEEMGEEGSNIQCADHHFKNGSSPGGICALCLQEKLGKLATSSFPEPILVPSSSSSSMSPLIKSRSEFGSIETNACSSSTSSHMGLGTGSSNDCECHQNHRRRGKFPFLLNHGKKKKKDGGGAATRGDTTSSIVFQRSKSTATHRTGFNLKESNEDHSQEKRGFWSFLYLPSTKHSATTKAATKPIPNTNPTISHETKNEELVVVEENESPDEAAFENRVSRSRSIACGSRSFSGDLFGRLSTGFGDCTLRRVESHREGKNKLHSMMHRNSVTGGECMKQRVKCGGIFSGFMIASSSSTTSSPYCISSVDEESANGKTTETRGRRHIGDLSQAR